MPLGSATEQSPWLEAFQGTQDNGSQRGRAKAMELRAVCPIWCPLGMGDYLNVNLKFFQD